MGAQTWYRGFALGVEPTKKDAGGLHDVGNGIYFASDIETARDYAKLRDPGGSSQGTMVFQVEIDMQRFRVLDLVNDARWQSYLNSKMIAGGPSNIDLMKMGSEQYSNYFTAFCKEKSINLNNYDMVIADDFHSGGTGRRTAQMVLLYKNAGYTTLHGEFLSKMQMVERNGTPVRTVVDKTRVVGGPNTTRGAQILRPYIAMPTEPGAAKSAQAVKLDRAALGAQTRNAKVVGNAGRAAEGASLRWTGYAMAVSKVAFYLNSASLEYRVKEELVKRKAEITAAFDNRQGVLVIIHVAVEKHSESGFLAKSFEKLWLQPGGTADEALARWTQTPGLFASLPPNAPYAFVEEYRWLEVDEEL